MDTHRTAATSSSSCCRAEQPRRQTVAEKLIATLPHRRWRPRRRLTASVGIRSIRTNAKISTPWSRAPMRHCTGRSVAGRRSRSRRRADKRARAQPARSVQPGMASAKRARNAACGPARGQRATRAGVLRRSAGAAEQARQRRRLPGGAESCQSEARSASLPDAGRSPTDEPLLRVQQIVEQQMRRVALWHLVDANLDTGDWYSTVAVTWPGIDRAIAAIQPMMVERGSTSSRTGRHALSTWWVTRRAWSSSRNLLDMRPIHARGGRISLSVIAADTLTLTVSTTASASRADAAKLFEPFVQTRRRSLQRCRAGHRAHGGTALTQAHGGTLVAHSAGVSRAASSCHAARATIAQATPVVGSASARRVRILANAADVRAGDRDRSRFSARRTRRTRPRLPRRTRGTAACWRRCRSGMATLAAAARADGVAQGTSCTSRRDADSCVLRHRDRVAAVQTERRRVVQIAVSQRGCRRYPLFMGGG